MQVGAIKGGNALTRLYVYFPGEWQLVEVIYVWVKAGYQDRAEVVLRRVCQSPHYSH